MAENGIITKTDGDTTSVINYSPEIDGEKIIYKNVRKVNLPSTADIAYCEIRITELQAELEAQREVVFKLEQQSDLYVTYEQTINQLQERNQILNDENKQLNITLKARIRDIDKMKLQILDQDGQLERLRDIEQDFINLQALLQLKENELLNLIEKYGQMELQISKQKVLELTNFDLNNKVTNLENDLELFKNKYNKLDEERKRLQNLQQDLSIISRIDSIAQSTVATQQQIISPQQQPQDYQKYKQQLQEQQNIIAQLKNELFEKEHNLNLQNTELNKLQEQLISKNDQIQQLQIIADQNDLNQKELQKVSEQLKTKPITITKIVEKIIKINPTEIDQDKIKLQNELDKSLYEIENLKFNISQLQQKLETQEIIISNLSRDIRQLVQLNEEIELLKIDKSNLQNLLVQKEQDLEFSLKLLNQKTIELQNIEKLKFNLQIQEQQVQNKQREIINLKKRIGDLENSNNQLKQLQPQIRENQNLIEKLKNSNLQLEQDKINLINQLNDSEVIINQLKKLESKIKAVQNTNSSLREEITQNSQETEQWRQKYNQGCSEINRLQRLLEINQQRQQKLSEENKNFNKDFSIPEIKIDSIPQITKINKSIIQDESKISQLQNNQLQLELQIDSLTRNKIFESQHNQMQLDELNARYQLKKAECENWKNKYIKSEEENTKFMNINEKYQEIQLKYNSQQIIIQALNDRIKSLSQQIEQQRSEIFNIQTQLLQIDILKQEKNQLQQKSDIYYKQIQELSQQIPLLKNIIMDLEKQIAIKNIPIIQIPQKLDIIEKYRTQIIELESKIDDTLEDQIEQLQQTIKTIQQELDKQIEQNQQLIKQLQNSERQRLDILIQLQLLETVEIDSQQLKQSYNNLKKLNDNIMSNSDKIEFKQRDLEHQIHIFDQQNKQQQNEINQLQIQNKNLITQKIEQQQNINHLELINNDQQQKIQLFPQLQETIYSQSQQIQEFLKSINQLQQNQDRAQAKCLIQENKLKTLIPLESKIDTLELMLDDRSKQLEIWQNKCVQLENNKVNLNQEWRRKIEQLQQQLKNQKDLESIINQQNNDIESILQQNEKYNSQNTELNLKLSQINKECDSKDIEIKRLQAIENDFRQLDERFLLELQRVSDLQDKLYVTQNLYDAAKRDQERLENKCAMMSSEIERLSIMVKNKNVEIEGNRVEQHQQQQQLDQVEPIYKENKRLFDELNNALKTNEELKGQVIQLQKLIDELKSQLNWQLQQQDQFKQELYENDTLLRRKDEEISEIKQILRQSENQIKEIKRDENQWMDIQSEKEQISNSLKQVTELLQQKSNENETLIKQNHNLQTELLDNKNLDFEHLELALNARDKEINEWKLKFDKLKQDMIYIQTEKQDLENKLMQIDFEIERWKRKVNSNSGEIDVLRNTIESLNDEIERLNKNTMDLFAENDSWRQKYGNLQQLIPQMVNLQPNPDTQAYQVTPGNSFRIPSQDRGQGSFRNQPQQQLDNRRSFRRATTIGISRP